VTSGKPSREELILLPSAEHDDLLDRLQTTAKGAMMRVGEFGCMWL